LIEADATRRDPRSFSVQAPRNPAIMIDCAVPEHLEVLRGTSARRIIVREGIGHADAFDRLLRHALHHAGLGNARCFEDRWRDVAEGVKLRAKPALVLDALRAGYNQTVACATEVRGDLLHPLERR